MSAGRSSATPATGIMYPSPTTSRDGMLALQMGHHIRTEHALSPTTSPSAPMGIERIGTIKPMHGSEEDAIAQSRFGLKKEDDLFVEPLHCITYRCLGRGLFIRLAYLAML